MPLKCVKGSNIWETLLQHRAYRGTSIATQNSVACKQISPLDYTWITHVILFLYKHGKHANTHNCILVENPSVSFWPRSSLQETPARINGAFLLCGGKPHTHSVTRTRSRGNPLTHSHAPDLCKCQTVGERVYLGEVWYFYTFFSCLNVTLSY